MAPQPSQRHTLQILPVSDVLDGMSFLRNVLYVQKLLSFITKLNLS